MLTSSRELSTGALLATTDCTQVAHDIHRAGRHAPARAGTAAAAAAPLPTRRSPVSAAPRSQQPAAVMSGLPPPDYTLNEEGERVVAASRRPDGTVRKERRVRSGYVPQDEQQVYVSRGAAVSGD